jgi:hypothetical protein
MAQEKNLENKIKDFLKKNNIYHFKTKGGIYGTIGLPDLVICINGKFVGLELKSKIGKVSLQQYKNGAKITENKGIFAVIDDYDKFLELYNDLIKNKKVIRHTLSFEELSNLYKDTKEKKINNYMKKLNNKEESTNKVKRKVTKSTKTANVVNAI